MYVSIILIFHIYEKPGSVCCPAKYSGFPQILYPLDLASRQLIPLLGSRFTDNDAFFLVLASENLGDR